MILGYRYKVTDIKNENYKLVKSVAIYPTDRLFESQPAFKKYYEVSVSIESAGHIGYVRPFHGSWEECIDWIGKNLVVDENIDYWQEMMGTFEESSEALSKDLSPLSKKLKIFVDELTGYFKWCEKNKPLTTEEIKTSFNSGIWKRYE